MGKINSKTKNDLFVPVLSDTTKSEKTIKKSSDTVPIEILGWMSRLVDTDVAIRDLQEALSLGEVIWDNDTCTSDKAYILLSKWWNLQDLGYFTTSLSLTKKLESTSGQTSLIVLLLADHLFAKDAIERISSYITCRNEYKLLTDALHSSPCDNGKISIDFSKEACKLLERWWEEHIHLNLESRLVKLINCLNTSGLNYTTNHLKRALKRYRSFYENWVLKTVTDENSSVCLSTFDWTHQTTNVNKWKYITDLVKKSELNCLKNQNDVKHSGFNPRFLKWIEWCFETSSHAVIGDEKSDETTFMAEDLLRTKTAEGSPLIYPNKLQEMVAAKILQSAKTGIHLYATQSSVNLTKAGVILKPSLSLSLQIPKEAAAKYYYAAVHLDPTPFADIIPNTECLVAAIPEFHCFPVATLPTGEFYKIKLEHCLKGAEERKWVTVRQGSLRTGERFEEVHHLLQATRDEAFYEIDEHYITIYTRHFTEFVCTVCKKTCDQRARMFIFGSVKEINKTKQVTIRPYMCSSLYSTEIFRQKLFTMEKACKRVLLEEGDVELPSDMLHFPNHTVQFSLQPDVEGWELACASGFKVKPTGSFIRVRKIGDVFDYQNCHICSMRDPNEICTCYLKYRGFNLTHFEATASVMFCLPVHSRDEGIEVSGDEDTDTDNDAPDVTEFRIAMKVPGSEARHAAAEMSQLGQEEQLFLRRVSQYMSNVDKLWDVGLELGATDAEMDQIRADNPSIKQSAFKTLMFCYSKKKTTWQEFHSKLRIAFEKSNMVNEFEKLNV